MMNWQQDAVKCKISYEVLRKVGNNYYYFVLLQPLRWCCVDCVIHHEQDVREE